MQRAIEGLGGGDLRGWSCWDLGAHYGVYAVGLALRVGPGGQVAAFEPNPKTFARLERHRRMNRLPWLKTYKAAASDRPGTAQLLTYGVADSTSAHLPYDGEVLVKRSKPVPVRALRLDALVESGELRSPDFVKVDVEGHGHLALEGMRAALAASHPQLLIAFHSAAEVRGALAILEPLGYTWRAVGPANASAVAPGGDYAFAV